MRCSLFLYPASIARCQHIKVNGIQCGSPALKDRKFCYFHQRWHKSRIQINANRARRAKFSIDFPILEDANSIQVALMQTTRLLLTNQIDQKTAALILYALQTASSNLRDTEFEPRPQEVVIDPAGVPDTSLGDDAWYRDEFKDQPAADDETEQDEPEEDEAKDKVAADAKDKVVAGAEDKVEAGAEAKKPGTVNLQAVGRRLARSSHFHPASAPRIARFAMNGSPQRPSTPFHKSFSSGGGLSRTRSSHPPA